MSNRVRRPWVETGAGNEPPEQPVTAIFDKSSWIPARKPVLVNCCPETQLTIMFLQASKKGSAAKRPSLQASGSGKSKAAPARLEPTLAAKARPGAFKATLSASTPTSKSGAALNGHAYRGTPSPKLRRASRIHAVGSQCSFNKHLAVWQDAVHPP